MHEAKSEKAFYTFYKKIKNRLRADYENGTLVESDKNINYE